MAPIGSLDNSPAGSIKRLDAALGRQGSTIIVQRAGSPTPTEIAVTGIARGYKPEELVGDVRQGDVSVILSPSGLSSLLPLKRSDKLFIAGAQYNIEAVEHVRRLDQVVRINLQVRG